MLLGFLFYVTSFILIFDIVMYLALMKHLMDILSFSKKLNPDQLYYLNHLFICHSSLTYRQYHIFIYRSLCYVTVVRFILVFNVVNVFFVKWIFKGISLFLNNLKLKHLYLLFFFTFFLEKGNIYNMNEWICTKSTIWYTFTCGFFSAL